MRVAITIDPRGSHRDRARSGWRVREKEDSDGREVLVFEFMESLDAIDFSMRTVASEHQGRLV